MTEDPIEYNSAQDSEYIRNRTRAAMEADGPYKVLLIDQFDVVDGAGEYGVYPTFAEAVEVARAITESGIRHCGSVEEWRGMGDTACVYDIHHMLVWSGVTEYSKMKGPLKDPDGICRAVAFATKAHAGQLRKGTDVPYVTHPISVGMLLARAGCADDLVMAGILHDCLEDTETTFEQLEDEFNEKVAEIVQDCSEQDKSDTWINRKKATVKKLKTASDEACLVSCADKTHNLWSMIKDYEQHGESLWSRFNATRESQIWYYRALGTVFSEHDPQHNLFQDYQEHLKTFLELVEPPV